MAGLIAPSDLYVGPTRKSAPTDGSHAAQERDMSGSDQKSRVLDFIEWLRALGGLWHEDLEVKADEEWGGIAPFASSDIPPDTTVIAIPHHLVVTREIAVRGLATVCGMQVGGCFADDECVDLHSCEEVNRNAAGKGMSAGVGVGKGKDDDLAKEVFGGLQERQLLGGYVVMHWVLEDGLLDSEGERTAQLHHLPYIRSLPALGTILTPCFWSEEEIALIRGTNLAYAVDDRLTLWKGEYDRLLEVLRSSLKGGVRSERPEEGILKGFSWERYLLAQTYITSRAFPSTLLDKFAQLNPSSTVLSDTDEGTYPVLLPGVDMLNHRRGEKVTWGSRRVAGTREVKGGLDALEINASKSGLTTPPRPEPEREQELVVLVVYDGRKRGEQVFNNYGLKGNEEMILGYGFAIEPNPDDNCVLKLGSGSADRLPPRVRAALNRAGVDFARSYYIGRDGEIPFRLWECVREIVAATSGDVGEEGEEEEETPMEPKEIELAVSEQLEGMVSQKLAGLKGRVGSLQDPDAVRDCRPIVLNMIRLYFEAQVEILTTTRSNLRKRMNELEIELYGEEGEIAMRDSD